jgi:hypothetical protein
VSVRDVAVKRKVDGELGLRSPCSLTPSSFVCGVNVASLSLAIMLPEYVVIGVPVNL